MDDFTEDEFRSEGDDPVLGTGATSDDDQAPDFTAEESEADTL